jgi:hypothetical protein
MSRALMRTPVCSKKREHSIAQHHVSPSPARVSVAAHRDDVQQRQSNLEDGAIAT